MTARRRTEFEMIRQAPYAYAPQDWAHPMDDAEVTKALKQTCRLLLRGTKPSPERTADAKLILEYLFHGLSDSVDNLLTGAYDRSTRRST